MNGLTMGEWYCGAGIGAVGFKEAGYDIKYAFDFNKYAIKTYRENHGDHAWTQNVRELDVDALPDVDVITGGFPCTAFSVGGVGLGSVDQKKGGDLGKYFFEGIERKMPKAFLAENVEGLTFEKHRPFLHSLIGHMYKVGYNVIYQVVDCWEYGVPQSRSRIFIAGIRKDLNKHFVFPNPVPVEERPTLRDAIGDLPAPEEALAQGIKNHDRYHIGGHSSRDLMGKTRQRQWDEPSYTIVSSARHMPMYPEPANYDWRMMTEEQRELNPPPRRFTVRECLRIQTVPDSYYFPDDDSMSERSLLEKQYERCSGIPPLVAYKLSKQLADILTEKIVPQNIQKRLF
jgi:DNA (cytosine-5)-methyltransferase 1